MNETTNDTRTAIDTTFAASVASASKAIAATHGQDAKVTGFVDQAYRAVKTASITARQNLDAAERIAANQTLFPAGRAAEVEATRQATEQKINQAVSDAEVGIKVAEAQLIMAARPVAKNEVAGQNHLAKVLEVTPADQRGETIRRLAGAGNDASAALFSDFGKDLLSAYGVDPAVISSLDQWNIEAAREHGTGTRKAAAETYRNLGELRKAVDGVRMGAYMAQQHLAKLHAKAAADPRDAELRSLRDQVATLKGHSRRG